MYPSLGAFLLVRLPFAFSPPRATGPWLVIIQLLQGDKARLTRYSERPVQQAVAVGMTIVASSSPAPSANGSLDTLCIVCFASSRSQSLAL